MDIPHLLFSFSGRMNRQPYWLIGIGVSLAGGTMSFAAGFVAGVVHLPESLLMVGVFGAAIAAMWISLAMSVKRAHDRGRSGLFILLFLIPLVNLWPLVELYFLPGTSGENKFGPDPLGSNM